VRIATGDFVGLLPLEDVPAGSYASATLGSHAVLVCRTEEGVFVVEDKCSHMGFPLRGGRLAGVRLCCPEHGAEFDVRTGECLCAPATRPVRAFAARVRDGCVEACTEPLPGSVPAAFRPYGL